MTGPSISPSAVVTRSPDVFCAAVGDELVMMDVDSGTFYVLDEISTLIWERLAAPTLVSDLLVDIRERYEVGSEQCQVEVLTLLEQMRDSSLIRVGD